MDLNKTKVVKIQNEINNNYHEISNQINCIKEDGRKLKYMEKLKEIKSWENAIIEEWEHLGNKFNRDYDYAVKFYERMEFMRQRNFPELGLTPARMKKFVQKVFILRKHEIFCFLSNALHGRKDAVAEHSGKLISQQFEKDRNALLKANISHDDNPLILIRKLKVYYLSLESSLDELLVTSDIVHKESHVILGQVCREFYDLSGIKMDSHMKLFLSKERFHMNQIILRMLDE